MKKSIAAVIDCRSYKSDSNDFYTLSMWGKPCFEYVCDMVNSLDLFAKTYLLTDLPKIKALASKYDFEQIDGIPQGDTPKMLISGRAIFLTVETVRKVVSEYSGGVILPISHSDSTHVDLQDLSFTKSPEVSVSSAFVLSDGERNISYFDLPSCESLVINSVNNFELGLVLMKKKLGRGLLTESILNRIQEKTEIFRQCQSSDTVCLVGHSQLDNWNCTEISGKPVRNCGIRGISSVEYNEYILDKELLNCGSDTYIVMHGTNDIVYPYSDDFIIQSISRTFDYILQHHSHAKIYFLTISNTNGRLDRSNKRIDQLNEKIISAFSNRVSIISTKALSDEFGDLRSEYTLDGLHFSDAGYEKLKSIVEAAING